MVLTGAGCQRYIVLGAVDATTRTLLRETTDGTATPVTAGRLPLQIRAAHPTGRITVVWDHARYQHTPLVRAVAAFPRIDLVYLSPYSPNLIERVWKFANRTALANRSLADYPAFEAAIDDPLGTTHRHATASLLTLHPASSSTA